METTPEQLLSVANEILPTPTNSDNWRLRELPKKGIYPYCSYYGTFEPDTNNTQWRKLSEWCNDKRVFISLFKDRYYAMQVEVSIHHDGDVGYVLVHDSFETQTECMIAAVLAYLENKND